MPTKRVNDIDMWYEFEGDGPVLVLTHGFAGPTEGWPPIIDDLRARYKLLLYDVRGHGRTSLPDASTFSMPQFAADLAGLMDALGIERPHLGGVSMGGMISAQFACDYPDRMRSLWLCDTTAGNQGDPATAQIERYLVDIFKLTQRATETYGLAGLVERENRYTREHDKYAIHSSFTLEEQYERNNKKTERMTAEGFIAANIALRERPDLIPRTPSISVPTLVSCGEWDMFYPCAQRDHALIPNSRLATVLRAAHDTTNYRPQSWKRAIADFIDDVEAGRDVRGEVVYDD